MENESVQGVIWLRRLAMVVGLLIILAIGLTVHRSATFRFVGTDPNINAVATTSPFFKINFSKNLGKGVVVTTNPLSLMASYQVSGSSVIVLLNSPLEANHQYRINVANISDVKGQRLANRSFVFSARNIAFNNLPADQKKALLSIQSRYNQVIQGDKLVQLLPFTSGGNEYRVSYTVNYINQQPKLTIIITAPTQQRQAEAINWIKEVGFNPNKYTIQYVTSSF